MKWFVINPVLLREKQLGLFSEGLLDFIELLTSYLVFSSNLIERWLCLIINKHWTHQLCLFNVEHAFYDLKEFLPFLFSYSVASLSLSYHVMDIAVVWQLLNTKYQIMNKVLV